MSQDVGEITIRLANESDFDSVVELMNSNFPDTPFFAWTMDDPEARAGVTKEFFKVHMRLGLDKGTVNIAECSEMGLAGAAIWCPKGALDAEANAKIQKAAGAASPRFQLLVDTFQEHYPPAATFEHLMWISVNPKIHGKGVGGKLLKHRLRELDEKGIPAYLEATTRQSARGAYERAGFQPIGEPVRLPRGVQAFPMWRYPKEASIDTAVLDIDDVHDEDKAMYFGGHRWWVLEVKDDKALLLCDSVIDKKCYHDTYEDITWADCTLRKFLNEDFYNTINESDRSRILETQLQNKNNPWFGTNGGRDTTDKIFLLGIDEVVKYFGDSGQLKEKNPDSTYFINDNFNSIRASVNEDNLASSWWLRTPGNNPKFAVCVTIEGRIAVSGDFVNRDYFFVGGYRPAMWITL